MSYKNIDTIMTFKHALSKLTLNDWKNAYIGDGMIKVFDITLGQYDTDVRINSINTDGRTRVKDRNYLSKYLGEEMTNTAEGLYRRSPARYPFELPQNFHTMLTDYSNLMRYERVPLFSKGNHNLTSYIDQVLDVCRDLTMDVIPNVKDHLGHAIRTDVINNMIHDDEILAKWYYALVETLTDFSPINNGDVKINAKSRFRKVNNELILNPSIGSSSYVPGSNDVYDYIPNPTCASLNIVYLPNYEYGNGPISKTNPIRAIGIYTCKYPLSAQPLFSYYNLEDELMSSTSELKSEFAKVELVGGLIPDRLWRSYIKQINPNLYIYQLAWRDPAHGSPDNVIIEVQVSGKNPRHVEIFSGDENVRATRRNSIVIEHGYLEFSDSIHMNYENSAISYSNVYSAVIPVNGVHVCITRLKTSSDSRDPDTIGIFVTDAPTIKGRIPIPDRIQSLDKLITIGDEFRLDISSDDIISRVFDDIADFKRDQKVIDHNFNDRLNKAEHDIAAKQNSGGGSDSRWWEKVVR